MHKFEDVDLHLISDASTKASGTVAYLCATTNKEITMTFVAFKNRVAPLKILMLPKLKLWELYCQPDYATIF